MLKFRFDLKDYEAGTDLEVDISRCQTCMRQLVERYGWQGKSIVSVGGGCGHEEIGMLRAGARRAVIYDIDEHGRMVQYLPNVKPCAHADPQLTFHLCDFRSQSLENLEQHDVLYFSGFTPDEKYRRNRSKPWQYLNHAVRKVTPWLLPGLRRIADPSWPPGAHPLHPIVRQAMRMLLKPGGTLVVQSYYGSVDLRRNPRFISVMQRAFGKLDVELVETYCFRSLPGVALWVGIRRPAEQAIRALRGRPLITRFHGRSELGAAGIDRLFTHADLQSLDASPNVVGTARRVA